MNITHLKGNVSRSGLSGGVIPPWQRISQRQGYDVVGLTMKIWPAADASSQRQKR